MSERAILLDLNESHLDKPPGSAAYQFVEVTSDPLPQGDHALVGKLNGVSVYIADPCLDLDSLQIDGEHVFSSGAVRLWKNEFSSISGGLTFEDFVSSELGDFIAQNHERMKSGKEFELGECYVVSHAEPETPAANAGIAFDLKRTT